MGFAADVEKFTIKAKLKSELLVRKVVIDVASELIKLSPVDTGMFRANWFIANGDATTETTRTPDRTGLVAIGRAHLAANYIKGGGITTIFNNMPYGMRLEFGWSQQAPAGMVRITVTRWQSIVQQVARNLDS